MATPVDFSQMETITALVRDGRLDPEDVIEPTGNVPPDVIENGFKLLKPTAEVTQYATLWENLWNDEFMEGYQAMGQWARDHIPFPGAAFAQTVEGLVRANGLVDGTFELGGETVDLKAITRPVLNIMAERDHIVPLAAAEPLLGLVGSEEKEELRLAAGHAGLVAGRKAAKVTLPGIAGWFNEHTRGDLMEIREPSEADLDALLAFFERVPESERTFFKEPVLDRATVEGWLTGERGRRGLAFSDDGARRRLRRRHPPHRLVRPRRRGPARRRPGGARAGARPRARPLGAAAGARRRPEASSPSRSWRSRRVRSRCSAASASRPRGCCATTCATATASCAT